MKILLFIDGRNFLTKISSILSQNKKRDSIDLPSFNFVGLIDKVLTGITTDKRIFYLGKLERHIETEKKSDDLIEKQRLLKLKLEKQGFEVVIAGRVRGHLEKCPKGHETLVFKEKGVDVKISVDMITMACNKQLKTAILGSSDSDMQPAIKGLREQGVQCIYLGFESQPNKGLAFTTNRTILIRDSEVEEFYKLKS